MNRFFAVAVFCVLHGASFAFADVTMVEEQTPPGHGLVTYVYKMSITPAAEPIPAFKYRLTVPPEETISGNAATHYLRSFGERSLHGSLEVARQKFGDEFYDWIGSEIAIEDLPLDKVREASQLFDSYVDHFIVRATKCRTCDWGLGEEEPFGNEIYGFLLPEVPQNRLISRVLALRTRLAIAEGRYAEAVDHLKMNYQLGRNGAQIKFLVADLVGISIAGISHGGMIDLIGAKDSPNMYWALAGLPTPLIDISPAVKFELAWGTRLIPELRGIETAEHSDSEWKRILGRLIAAISGARQSIEASDQSLVVPYDHALMELGLGLVSYAPAKKRLATEIDTERLEAMSVSQVMLIDMVREYRRIADEHEKSLHIPFLLARPYLERAEQQLRDGDQGIGSLSSLGHIAANLLLPALTQIRVAQVRIQWQLNALLIVEAIRMHLAQTGRLPASLEEITLVPIPENPFTGQPYSYRLDGETAIIDLPFSDGSPGFAQRFEITVAK